MAISLAKWRSVSHGTTSTKEPYGDTSYKRFLSCCAILPARIARNQLLIHSWVCEKQLAELKGNDEDLSWSILKFGNPRGKLCQGVTKNLYDISTVPRKKCYIKNFTVLQKLMLEQSHKYTCRAMKIFSDGLNLYLCTSTSAALVTQIFDRVQNWAIT